MANRALFLNYSIYVSPLSVYFPTISWRALSNYLLESSNKAILYRTINSGVFTRIRISIYESPKFVKFRNEFRIPNSEIRVYIDRNFSPLHDNLILVASTRVKIQLPFCVIFAGMDEDVEHGSVKPHFRTFDPLAALRLMTQSTPLEDIALSAVTPVTLEFYDLNYKIKPVQRKKKKSHHCCKKATDGEYKTILNGVSGYVTPGQVLIMNLVYIAIQYTNKNYIP